MKRLLLAFVAMTLMGSLAAAHPPQRHATITFAAGSDHLGDESRGQIDTFARAWNSQPTKVIGVYGYATLAESEGRSPAAAERISQRRADNVSAALVRSGVPRGAIDRAGLGASPIRNTAVDAAVNQRVEIFASDVTGW